MLIVGRGITAHPAVNCGEPYVMHRSPRGRSLTPKNAALPSLPRDGTTARGVRAGMWPSGGIYNHSGWRPRR